MNLNGFYKKRDTNGIICGRKNQASKLAVFKDKTTFLSQAVIPLMI